MVNKKNKRSYFPRLAIDCLMGIFVIVAMTGRYLENTIHETMGILFVIAATIHCFQRLSWFKTNLRGTYRSRRILITGIVLLLLLTTAVLAVHGMMMSRTWFSFIEFKSSFTVRQIHTTAAYWMLIFMGIHTGLHWTKVKRMLKKQIRVSQKSVRLRCLFRGLKFFIVAVGIFAFLDKDVFPRLFMVYAFDFQNPELSIVQILSSYLAISIGCAIVANKFWSVSKNWRKN